MTEEKNKKISNLFWKAFDYFYIAYFALVLIFVAFIFFVGFNDIFNSSKMQTSDVLVFSTALIAINIAFAAMVFSYSSNLDMNDKSQLVKIGEKFILSSVAFILNISLIGLTKTGYMDKLFDGLSFKQYLSWAFVVALLFLSLVAFILFIYGTWKLISFIIRRK